MGTSKYKELQNAVEVLRGSVKDPSINLDFSVNSVKHIDYILDVAFNNGKLKNPNGAFAEHLGLMMLGMSGYLTEVIIRNTNNTKVDINEGDENWYTSFNLIAENGWTARPAQRVMKRAYEGKVAELLAYTLSTIKYFNSPLSDSPPIEGRYVEEVYVRDDQKQKDGKPWWKFW